MCLSKFSVDSQVSSITNYCIVTIQHNGKKDNLSRFYDTSIYFDTYTLLFRVPF